MSADEEISVGVLSKETGLSTATINFYVQQGVLPPPRKLNRTRALYNQRHLRLIKVIRRMQAQGLSLAQVRSYFQHVGTDDTGLKKLESIGRMQPLAPPRGAPNREPIEPFEPVDRAAFLARAGVDAGFLDRMESIGLVRPLAAGRYDHADLWMVWNIRALLDDGIDESQLGPLADLVGPLRRAAPLLLTQVRRHVDELRARDLRVGDLMAPYANTARYLFDRVIDESDPRWRELLWGPREG